MRKSEHSEAERTLLGEARPESQAHESGMLWKNFVAAYPSVNHSWILPRP